MSRASLVASVAVALALAACGRQQAQADAPPLKVDSAPAVMSEIWVPTPTDHPEPTPHDFEVLNESAAAYATNPVLFVDGSTAFTIAKLDEWARNHEDARMQWAYVEDQGVRRLIGDMEYTRSNGDRVWYVFVFDVNSDPGHAHVREFMVGGENLTSMLEVEEIMRGIQLDMYHQGMITL